MLKLVNLIDRGIKLRILLVALNASYVHTNLAIRYLREVLVTEEKPEWEIHIREFTINERLENIAAEIFEQQPDILGFSCYIWNIQQILALLRRLRRVLPRTFFLGGGPEVSFDSEKLLGTYPEWDGIIPGEGEYTLRDLVKTLSAGNRLSEVKGLVWRDRQGLIMKNPAEADCPDLNQLPNPYIREESFKDRLVYVETSRGCPFQCEFCISSTTSGIRYLKPEGLRLVLRRLFDSGATTIKFVDRTFNASKKHALAILDLFREEAQRKIAERIIAGVDESNEGVLRAHCEMAGELLDEEWLEYLSNYPQGMVQLEIGVQSTHQPTLKAVRRVQKFSRWQAAVRFLQHSCGIPIHLDLIAGLPLEGWQELRQSFDEVFGVRPDRLQLGFLKVLKGSGIWEKSEDYGFEYAPDPPYTILKTRELTHTQIINLNRIEEVVEKYYNSGKFKYSLEYIFLDDKSPFDFFDSFAQYWRTKGWFGQEWSSQGLFRNLGEFLNVRSGGQTKQVWREALRFDYFRRQRPGQIPYFLQDSDSIDCNQTEQNMIREKIRKDPVWKTIIPESIDSDRRQWARSTAIEYFTVDIPGGLKNPQLETGCWYLFYSGQKKTKYFKYPQENN